jgi:hypothetical protein
LVDVITLEPNACVSVQNIFEIAVKASDRNCVGFYKMLLVIKASFNTPSEITKALDIEILPKPIPK